MLARAPLFCLLAFCLLALCIACGGSGTPPGVNSVLFPATWTPQRTGPDGRFLHDFSYAGYRNGAAPLPSNVGATVFEVVADTTGATDATAAVQSAIDAATAAGGGVVHIPAGLYRCDGQLSIRASGIVLRGDGPELTRVYFTRYAGMTDRGHIEVRGGVSTGAEYALVADGAPRAHEVVVVDASGLGVGADVGLGWVITPEYIAEHAMTGTWQAFNGSWQTFERRTIVAIDGNRVRLDVPLRYAAKMRDGASLRLETGYLAEVGIERIAVANSVAWDDAWSELRVHAIEMQGVKDAWVRDVATFAPPGGDGLHLQSGGILVLRSKRVTIADSRLQKAQNRGGGGCGYLFEIRQSSDVLTRDCVALAGRHNYIQNWGFGTTGCVWLRCHSADGLAVFSSTFPRLGTLGFSEFHHSLATANLIDSCSTDDGWSAVNRGAYSSGAGHSATGCVFWNLTGTGVLRSQQFGHGYVIGTGPDISLITDLVGSSATGTAPTDWVEGVGEASTLKPSSLYLAQYRMRTGFAAEAERP